MLAAAGLDRSRIERKKTMPYVHIVIGLALIEFLYFGFAVGQARVRYKVPAPATSGDEVFERYFRVQMNTLEQLVVFLPSILIFSHYFSCYVAAGLGAIFVIGRLVYFLSYVKEPKKREIGFMLTMAPNAILLLGGLFGAARAALHL
jgi:glutathione S-transferase